MNFRRAGRKAANTPYAALGSSSTAPASSSRAPATAASDQHDASDDSSDYVFDYVDVDSSCSSRDVEGSYHA